MRCCDARDWAKHQAAKQGGSRRPRRPSGLPADDSPLLLILPQSHAPPPISCDGGSQACGAGRRAARAADLLEAAGYGDLKVFKAGWTGWKAEGRPEEKQ
jgi:hypothetical protein